MPYVSLYDEGFSRVGCMICPLAGKHDKLLKKERWPGPHKAFEHAVKKWWEANKSKNRKGNLYSNADEFLKAWYNEFK